MCVCPVFIRTFYYADEFTSQKTISTNNQEFNYKHLHSYLHEYVYANGQLPIKLQIFSTDY
jgi:hypothetical protein